ncbi:conserved hypothetical protein [Paraburkholderia sabiae]|nr:conserved hypothetical protein [Paraburkholderia sabiae]
MNSAAADFTLRIDSSMFLLRGARPLITRLLKLSLFFRPSVSREAGFVSARAPVRSRSADALPAEAFRAAFMRIDWPGAISLVCFHDASSRRTRFSACNTDGVDAYKLQRSPLTGSCPIEVIRGSLE